MYSYILVYELDKIVVEEVVVYILVLSERLSDENYEKHQTGETTLFLGSEPDTF
jgi:hypothetical protein